MILLSGVALGLVAGLIRARINGRQLRAPSLVAVWLAPVAFLPQWSAFFSKVDRLKLPDNWIPIGLMASLLLLLAFAWVNRGQPGFWVLGIGLALNLLVIALNGGWMPISPETLARMYPHRGEEAWIIGQRLGTSKDLIIATADTRLAWLSDRFTLPSWSPYQVAFSMGDIFIAAGAFWVLWSLGGPTHTNSED